MLIFSPFNNEYSTAIAQNLGYLDILFAYAVGILLAHQNRLLIYPVFLIPIAIGMMTGHTAHLTPSADRIMIWPVILLGLSLLGEQIPLIARSVLIALFSFAHGFVHGAETHFGLAILKFLLITSLLFYAGRLTARWYQNSVIYALLGGAMAIGGLLSI